MPPKRKPWRINSQVYVGFFGGPVGEGVIGVINARRLSLRALDQAAIAGAALAALGALVAVAAAVDVSTARLAFRIAGLAVYGVAYLAQRKADRIYHYYHGGEEAYSELFRPGLLAVLVGIAVEVAVIGAFADS